VEKSVQIVKNPTLETIEALVTLAESCAEKFPDRMQEIDKLIYQVSAQFRQNYKLRLEALPIEDFNIIDCHPGSNKGLSKTILKYWHSSELMIELLCLFILIGSLQKLALFLNLILKLQSGFNVLHLIP
jgi:hypothetical protein